MGICPITSLKDINNSKAIASYTQTVGNATRQKASILKIGIMETILAMHIQLIAL